MYNFKNKVLLKITKKLFFPFEKYLGLHLLIPHFYSPLPTVSQLTEKEYNFSTKGYGLNLSSDTQLAFLDTNLLQFYNEYTPQQNSGLSLVDAYLLYAFIRFKKPKRMIEIGSGESTFIALKALQKNKDEGFDFKFTAIEPYPRQKLKELCDENFDLLIKKVQEVDVSLFKDTDILFIDSSHVSKFGSDVNYEILEIVPSLKKGALIHWHDIFIPREYPKNWIQSGFQFWNESYMLQAFLSFNSDFKISWASKYMQTLSSAEIKNRFKYFLENHNISSIWVEKVH